jgi:TRAP-type C4-dicarboxylate transport system substrate-binding protein
MKFLLACSAFALAATLGAATTLAQSVTLKVATFTPARGLMATDILDPWLAKMEQDAGGDLKFEKYYGGTLGRDPSQYSKLVTDGVTDLGHVVSHYTIGQFRNAEEASLAYQRMLAKKMLRGYDGLQVLGVFTTGPAGIHTKPPIKSLADVRGLKLRTSGEGLTEAGKHLGAVGVPMPAPAVAENISRGVIDGTMLDWVAIKLFRVQEVAFYHLDVNLGVIPNTVMINPKSYEKLSAKAKAAATKHSGEAFARITGKYNDTSDAQNREALAKDSKHTVIALSAADKAQVEKVLLPMHEEWKKSRPNGEKLYAELQKILAEVRAGK